jgi:hypothetical protein
VPAPARGRPTAASIGPRVHPRARATLSVVVDDRERNCGSLSTVTGETAAAALSPELAGNQRGRGRGVGGAACNGEAAGGLN